MRVRNLYAEVLLRLLIARVKMRRDERGVGLDVRLWVAKVISNY